MSIIASDITIYGNIHSEGVVDIDGCIEGNVRCHTVTLRKNGHVKGDLVAENIVIYGTVQGLVKGRSIHFFKGCRVEGVIQHETITIEDGAFVDGRFKRCDHIQLDEQENFAAANANNRPPVNLANFSASTFLPAMEHAEGPIADFVHEPDGHDTVLHPEAKTETAKPTLRMLDNLKLISDKEE